MRQVVGQSEGGFAVYVLVDGKAISLTRKDPAFGSDLQALVEVEIEGIGILRNPVIDEADHT